MPIDRRNDAPAVDQTIEHAAKFLALVVWKLAPGGVRITGADLERFQAEGGILFTHGQQDGFTFKIVTPAEAERISAHDAATNRSRA